VTRVPDECCARRRPKWACARAAGSGGRMALAVSTRGWDKRGRTAAAVMATQPGMGASPWGRAEGTAAAPVAVLPLATAALHHCPPLHHWPLHHCIDAPAPEGAALPVALAARRQGGHCRSLRDATSPSTHCIAGSAPGIAGSAPAPHAPSLIATGRQPTGRALFRHIGSPPANGQTSRLRDYLCCRAGVPWLLREAAHPLS
jgi:hypothetical protein